VSPRKTVVNEVNALTGWSVSGGSNLVLDEVNYITGNAAIRFDLSGAAAYVENSTLTAVDLSDTTTQNSVFVWVYIPDASMVTSFNLQFGSSGSNYVNRTVTTPHAGTFADGWNLLRFDLDGATETGTVDYSAITFFRLTINNDGSGASNFRLDSIVAGIGSLYELVYYSDAIFVGADGTRKTVPDAETDTIALETDAYNIMVYECAYLLSQELQGTNGGFDESYFDKMLNGDGRRVGLYRRYHMSYPSQNKKARSSYYKMRRGTYVE